MTAPREPQTAEGQGDEALRARELELVAILRELAPQPYPGGRISASEMDKAEGIERRIQAAKRAIQEHYRPIIDARDKALASSWENSDGDLSICAVCGERAYGLWLTPSLHLPDCIIPTIDACTPEGWPR